MRLEVSKDARLEVKFVAPVHEIGRMENWLRLHPGDFYTPFPDRWVNNVYFDNYDCSAYSQNISGVSYRSKLRYRWYGQAEYPDEGNLEIKLKRNLFGWKRRFKCSDSPYSDGDRWADMRRKLAAKLGAEAKLWLNARPNPTILNRYYRQYFVTRDNRVRVTIDSRQTVFDQRYKSRPNVVYETNIPETMVVEVKFGRSDRDFGSQVIQRIPIRVSRNSKYVIGLKSMIRY